MKQVDRWRPTKFVPAGDGYRASRDSREVAPASRMITDRLATVYPEALRHHARGRLLDLGCGTVPLFDAYRRLVTDVVCVDWAARGGVSHLDLAMDLNERIPLPDGRFDTVLATDVFEHIARPAHLFEEVSRLLAPDGVMIAGVPFLYWIHEEPHDYYRYTEFALARLCAGSGLTVISVEPYGGAPEVVFDTLGKTFSYGALGASMLGRWLTTITVSLGDLLLATRVAHRVSQATAHSLPLGYCLVARKPPAGVPTGQA